VRPALLLAVIIGSAVVAAQGAVTDAPGLPAGLHEGRIGQGQRTLWWRLRVDVPERIELDLEILDPGVDLDLFLYRETDLASGLPERPPPGAWHESTRGPGIAHERVVATLAPGLYLVAVSSPQGEPARFQLLVERERVDAEALPGPARSRPLVRGATVSGIVDYDLGPREEWWHLEVSTPGAIAVDLAGDLPSADLNLSIHPPERPGVVLATSETPRSSFEVARLWASPGRYLIRVWAHASGNASGYRLSWRGASVEEISGPDATPDGASALDRGSGPRWIDSAGNRTDWWTVGPAGPVRYHGPQGVILSVFSAQDLSRAIGVLDGPGVLDTPAGAWLRVQAGPGASGAYELTPTAAPPARDGGQRPSDAMSVDPGSALAAVAPESRTAWFRIDWAGGLLRVAVNHPPGQAELSIALTDARVLRSNRPGYYANLRDPLAWGGADGAGGLVLTRDLVKGVYYVAVFLHSSDPVPFELRVGDGPPPIRPAPPLEPAREVAPPPAGPTPVRPGRPLALSVPGAATGVTTGEITWYELEIAAEGVLTLGLDIRPPTADLDLYLYRVPVATALDHHDALNFALRGPGVEREVIVHPVRPGLYAVAVAPGAPGASASYRLAAEFTPRVLPRGTFVADALTLDVTEVAEASGSLDYDLGLRELHYRIELARPGRFRVTLEAGPGDGDLDLEIRPPAGPSIWLEEFGPRQDAIVELPSGVTIIRVFAYDLGDHGDFILRIVPVK
jgi:hypothetical protein